MYSAEVEAVVVSVAVGVAVAGFEDAVVVGLVGSVVEVVVASVADVATVGEALDVDVEVGEVVAIDVAVVGAEDGLVGTATCPISMAAMAMVV